MFTAGWDLAATSAPIHRQENWVSEVLGDHRKRQPEPQVSPWATEPLCKGGKPQCGHLAKAQQMAARAGGVAQVVQWSPSKHEAVSSNPSTSKEGRGGGEEGEEKGGVCTSALSTPPGLGPHSLNYTDLDVLPLSTSCLYQNYSIFHDRIAAEDTGA
jgi:hypothetical protein